jgi:hypothetical protein
MVQQSTHIINKGGKAQFFYLSQRTSFAVTPAVEREQADSGRWAKQSKGLVGIAAKPVLENEGQALPLIAVMKS